MGKGEGQMKTPEELRIEHIISPSFIALHKCGVKVVELLQDGTLVINESAGFTLNEAARLFFEELRRLAVEHKGGYEITPQD